MALGIASIICCMQTFPCKAQEKLTKCDKKFVTEPNYALAERFSAERTAKMVFTTQVRPMWLRDGSRFIYQDVHYNLYRRAFDEKTRQFGPQQMVYQIEVAGAVPDVEDAVVATCEHEVAAIG